MSKFLLIFTLIISTALPAMSAVKDKKIYLKRSRWITEFKQGLLPDLCHEESYFRQCFTIDEKLCKTTAEKNLTRVIAAAKLPDRIELLQEGSAIAIDIGDKLGKPIEDDLKKFKINESPCNVQGSYR